MKRSFDSLFALLLVAGLVACSDGAQAEKTSKELSDGQIRQLLVKESINAYAGACPCPESRNDAGQKCGKNSAYSKSGGDSRPLCYPSNVSDTAIKKYREDHPKK